MCEDGRKELTTLYRLYGFGDQLLYIGITNNFTRRLYQHQTEKAWGANIYASRHETFHCRGCAESAERLAIITEVPLHNKAHNYDDPIVTSRWRCCVQCRTPTAPYEDAPDDQSWSWLTAYQCVKCGTKWTASWNYPIGDQILFEERLV